MKFLKQNLSKSPLISLVKKLFPIILIILSVLLLPAGCGKSPSENGYEKAMEKYEVTVDKSEQVSLKFVFPGQKPKNWDEVRAKIEEQISGTINATLDFSWFDYREYVDKVHQISASDVPFDAFCLSKPQNNYIDFTILAREGKLKDITQLLPDSAPSLMNKYSREELEFAKVDGKLYAVPSLYPRAFCTYLLVDDTMLKKYKISDISNFEEYGAYLRTIKNNEPDLIPGNIANIPDTLSLFARASGYVIADELQRLVYKWDDPAMKLYTWESTPEFKEYVNYIVNWFKNGFLEPVNDPAMNIRTTSFIFYDMLNPPQKDTVKLTFSTSANGDFQESNPLKQFYLNTENKVQRDNPMGSFFYNGSFAFPAISHNTEKALMFLEWVQLSRRNYYLTMYGIEDKDYVLKNELPSLPDGMEFKDRTYMHWDGSWALNNIEYNFTGKDENGKSLKEFLDTNSKYAPHGALYPNYKEVQTAADKRLNTCIGFENRLRNGQITDSSEIESFIKQQQDLGSANLVEAAQKQLDEAVKNRSSRN